MDAMMLAGTWNDAEALALTAQQWLITEGRVDHSVTVPLGDVAQDGTDQARPAVAGVGDLVTTRANDYELRTDQGDSVRNGNTWRVERIQTSHSSDQSRVWLSRTGSDDPDRVWVPASYLAEHARLAYGASVNNSQGATMDAALNVFEEGRSTQNLVYTGMTRGRFMNKARIVTAAENVEGHEHQGAPEQVRAPVEQAASMFADLIGRDRRDLSAHLPAERAARTARTAVQDGRGPELADEFEQAAQFTPAARARRERTARAAQASTAPDPAREQVRAVGDAGPSLPTPARHDPAEQAAVRPAPVAGHDTGHPQQQGGQDETGPMPVTPRHGRVPTPAIRAKLPHVPTAREVEQRRAEQARRDTAEFEAFETRARGWELVDQYTDYFDQSMSGRLDGPDLARADRLVNAAEDQFIAAYGQMPQDWAAQNPRPAQDERNRHNLARIRRTMEELESNASSMNAGLQARPRYRVEDVPIPDRHFEDLTRQERAHLWAHRDSPELADTARRVYDTAYAHQPDQLAVRDYAVQGAGPQAWRETLKDVRTGKTLPPIAWVRDRSIVDRIDADDRQKARATRQPAPTPEHDTTLSRNRPRADMAKVKRQIEQVKRQKELDENRWRDYGTGGPDRGPQGPTIGR